MVTFCFETPSLHGGGEKKKCRTFLLYLIAYLWSSNGSIDEVRKWFERERETYFQRANNFMPYILPLLIPARLKIYTVPKPKWLNRTECVWCDLILNLCAENYSVFGFPIFCFIFSANFPQSKFSVTTWLNVWSAAEKKAAAAAAPTTTIWASASIEVSAYFLLKAPKKRI